jgi:hypothetical protein
LGGCQIEVGFMLDQQPYYFDLLPMACCQQRCSAAFILMVDICALLEEEVDGDDASGQHIFSGESFFLLVGDLDSFDQQ